MRSTDAKKILTSIFIVEMLILLSISTACTANISKTTNESEKYAVIIVGCYGTGLPHQNMTQIDENRSLYYTYYLTDTQRFYNVLKNRYGYDDDHIFVLLTEIKEYEPPSEFDKSIIDLSSNKATIKRVLRNFKPGHKNALDENDSIFVLLLGHGLDGHYFLKQYFNISNPNGINAHNTFFTIEPGFKYIFRYLFKYDFFYYRLFFSQCALWDYQFSHYVKGVKAKMIFTFTSCNSGGFINDLSGENRIILTASKENEKADRFIGPLRWAINRENGVDADLNDDGMVSIAEAYMFAADFSNKHSNLGSQHPLLDDNGDKIGSYYNETSYDPDTLGMDGYLAAHTFL